MTIRPLDEQFDPEKVAAIRKLQSQAEALEIRSHSSRIFVAEVISALEAGLILSAILSAAALLELLVRATVIDRIAGVAGNAGPTRAEIASAIEEDNAMGFGNLVELLLRFGVLEARESARLRSLYRGIRIPLHHAIVGRYIRGRRDGSFEELFPEIAHFNQGIHFEEALEDHGVDELRRLLEGIELVVRLGAV
jgi:hypothetical protein